VASDWRVTVSLRGQPRRKRKPFRRAVVAGLHGRLGDGAEVTAGPRDIFVYARTAEAGIQAGHAAREALARQGAGADVRLERWDPVGRAWRDAIAEPPGEGEKALREAHDRLMERERLESAATGRAAWQVRVSLPRDGTEPLARLLEAEGWPVVRRRKYLLAGADCEDDANVLARRIQGCTSMEAVINVERVYGLPWWVTAQ
jgi:hypothetical protein